MTTLEGVQRHRRLILSRDHPRHSKVCLLPVAKGLQLGAAEDSIKLLIGHLARLAENVAWGEEKALIRTVAWPIATPIKTGMIPLIRPITSFVPLPPHPDPLPMGGHDRMAKKVPCVGTGTDRGMGGHDRHSVSDCRTRMATHSVRHSPPLSTRFRRSMRAAVCLQH